MPRKIAIVQSNYIPWKGYFDLINSVDEFILYDDAQYTKNDWRNRNIIRTAQGLKWLTIPVRREKSGQLIKDTKISDSRWPRKHWATLSQNYSKGRFFGEFKEVFEQLYLTMDDRFLSDINRTFLTAVNRILGIRTPLRWSSEFDLVGGRTERLLGICQQCGAEEYLSGPSARDYFDLALAEKENIKVFWMDYSGYPVYEQLHQPFVHTVSVLDLLFNTGHLAKQHMKSFLDRHVD